MENHPNGVTARPTAGPGNCLHLCGRGPLFVHRLLGREAAVRALPVSLGNVAALPWATLGDRHFITHPVSPPCIFLAAWILELNQIETGLQRRPISRRQCKRGSDFPKKTCCVVCG